jgi:HEAT repeat protein
VVIRASSAAAISALVADLASEHAVTREAAIARLTVIGGRAVGRLVALARDRDATPGARAAALQALAGIGDPQGLEPALEALGETDQDIAQAAIMVARAFLDSPQGIAALDRLTAIVLDRQRATADRLAALNALSDLGASALHPILAALADDRDKTLAAAAGLRRRRPAASPADQLDDAARGVLGDDPTALRQAIVVAGDEVPPDTLRQIIEAVHVREGGEPVEKRPPWSAVRASAHAVLARRGSREALYDLRETIASAREPIAVEFVAAATTIGDASCLDAIATAYAKSPAGASGHDWWRAHLVDAFRTIVRREALTRRHKAVQRIARRSKATLDHLWPRT